MADSTRRPNIADVAVAASVSQSTACRALNPTWWHIVNPETRKLVEEAAERIGYRRIRKERREPLVTYTAPPVAYVALSASRLEQSLRSAVTHSRRRFAVADAERQNTQSARRRADWAAYAIVPTTMPDGSKS